MSPGLGPPTPVRSGRWTPFRMIVVGAFLGLLSAGLDAVVTVVSNLGLLRGVFDAVPYGIVLLDEAMLGIAVPVGLFLVLCGLALHLRSHRRPGRSRSFHAALGGATFNLAAGLLIGVLHLLIDLLPPELFTLDLVRNLVLVLFVGAVAAALGLFIAFCGLAGLVQEAPAGEAGPPPSRVRAPRGKSIYRVVPSVR